MQVRDRIRELKRIPARSLRPHPLNWRTHPKEQRQAMRAALAEIGYADVLIVRQLEDGAYQLIDGHLRAEITPEQEVPAIVVDLDEGEARKLLATLDPLAALAKADEEQLKELAGLCDFESEELQALAAELVGNGNLPADGLTDPDDIPASPEEPITQPGDLWLLGEHRLLCGDATVPDDVALVMGTKMAALLATDPPYGVAYGVETAHGAAIQNDDNDGPKLQAFLERTFQAALPLLKDNAAWYLWHAQMTQGYFAAAAAAAAAAVLIHRQIVWVKPSLILGHGDYHWRHELCFYGWRQGHRPPWYGDRAQTTVWEIEREPHGKHPTAKPTEIFERPMRFNTQPGDVCFEPFSGSGSQIIAAERLQRRCYAIEIEPRHVDVAVKRWEDFTGKKAQRE